MSGHEGYTKLSDGRWKITANHTLQAATPEMLDWWWDHIDTTERYRLWHPTDHVSFEWVVPPTLNGHVGAIHRVQEFFNGTPAEGPVALEIRWEDPTQAETHYSHVLLATGRGVQESMQNATLMHEYEEMPNGTRMRSHFWFPSQAPEPALAALYQHNRQEMARLPAFLPWLYQSEVELPLGKRYFTLGDQRITRERISDSSGHAHLQYRLWDNWHEQVYHITASSVPLLLASQQIELTQWSWHLLEEGKHK